MESFAFTGILEINNELWFDCLFFAMRHNYEI